MESYWSDLAFSAVYGAPTEEQVKKLIKEYSTAGLGIEFVVGKLNGDYCTANIGTISSIWEYEENGIKKKGIKCSSYSGGIAGTSCTGVRYFDENGNLVKKDGGQSKENQGEESQSAENQRSGLDELHARQRQKNRLIDISIVAAVIVSVLAIIFIFKRKKRK